MADGVFWLHRRCYGREGDGVSSNSVKDLIRERRTSIGSWLSFGYAPVCEIMARAGFEWLVIDMEHTGIGVAEAHHLIQVADLAGCPPLVRVESNDAVAVKHAMDAGAHGVVVPQINSRAEAERAVASLYYPPRGERGAGLARAQGYGLGFPDYRVWAERESVLVVQIEHIDAVGRLEEILAVEEVDGFMVGPYDLSASVGVPGNWDHPDVIDALAEVKRVIAKDLKTAGYHVVHSDVGELSQRLDEGYRFIAYGDDMVFLAEKVRHDMEEVRVLLEGRGA